MNKVLENMISRMRQWPEDRQEDAARLLEAMEKTGTSIYRLTDEERRAVQLGIDEAERGEFASDDEMKQFWNRHKA